MITVMIMKKQKFKNTGGTITDWNILGWDFLGGGFSRGDLMGGSFLGVNFSEEGTFLIPFLLLDSKQRK